MSYHEIFNEYKPKAEFTIRKGIGSETGRYIASVYRKVIVSSRKRETVESAIAVLATTDIKEYFKFLEPYIEKVNP